MRRRSFLKSALAAVAFPAIIPSTVLGENAPSNCVTLAAIGMGGRATSLNLNDIAARCPDVRFLAVCDPMKERRDKGKDAFEHYSGKDSVAAYNDFREVLARDDIDGVVIATPDHWHVPIAIAASKAGKDMYVEKPLGTSMRLNLMLRDLVGANKNVFQYGTQQRAKEHVRRGCELVRNGCIGQLKHIEVWAPHWDPTKNHPVIPEPVPEGFDYDMWLGPAPATEYTQMRCSCEGAYHIYDYALGFIAGWGAHPLDVAQWGKPEYPVHFEGTGVFPPEGLFDTLATWDIQCKYEDGVTMRFTSSAQAQERVMAYCKEWRGDGTTFFGSDGWISISRGGIEYGSDEIRNAELGDGAVRLKATQGHQRDYIDCIKSREATVNPVDTAVVSDAISHLGNIAIRTGRSIQWDPVKETIVGDAEAAKMLDRPMREPWQL